jgi:hypothetical protein
LCYFHGKFGMEAFKCYEGCKHHNAHMAAKGSRNDSSNSQGRP